LSLFRAAKILVFLTYKKEIKYILAFMKFSDDLLFWYDENKRDLPWRDIDNPYVIWIAEVVFQQTRIEQGLPYFLEFIKKFPTVFDLAASSEEFVLKNWQGLGYYSRARNLHFSANFIVNELNGVFPKTYKDLLFLKGVGPYIAAEIASVCYNEIEPAIDGNVQRVISRYFGVSEPVNSSVGASQIKLFANEHISTQRPGDFNQALMDYGSSICSPKKPDCPHCLFNETCWANIHGKQNEIPVKLKKVKVRTRYFNFMILIKGDALGVVKRGSGDVWQGLYQPPLIEAESEVLGLRDIGPNFKGYLLSSSKRILSHQKLMLKFWVIKDGFEDIDFTDVEWVSLSKLSDIPVSKSIEELFSSKEFRSLFNSVDY
jgi:A/G-specific adenine glycosylase